MENIVHFEDFLLNEGNINESGFPTWKENGIVFIRGKANEDGKKFLYALKLIKVIMGSNGQYFKAFVKDHIYRVIKDHEGNYVPSGIKLSPAHMKNELGVSGRSFSLNSKHGKTPIWWETINRTNIRNICADHKQTLDDWDDIIW